jgi:hypothetical protein
VAGLTALDYAVREGQLGAAEALTQAGAAAGAPRLREAQLALARAPWLLQAAAAARAAQRDQQLLQQGKQPRLQPRVRTAASQLALALRAAGWEYVAAKLHALLQRDATSVTLHAHDQQPLHAHHAGGGAAGGDAQEAPVLHSSSAGRLALVVLTFAGALRCEGAPLPPLQSLELRGLPLLTPPRSAREEDAAAHIIQLVDAPLAALAHALAGPSAARHVSIVFDAAQRALPHGQHAAVAVVARPRAHLTPDGCAALCGALACAWAGSASLRSLRLQTWRPLCDAQAAALARAAEAPEGVVLALLMGCTHPRVGQHSPLRLLDTTLLRIIIAATAVPLTLAVA